MHPADQFASLWASASTWIYPCLWLLVGALAWARHRRIAGALFSLAGVSSFVFALLFSADSAFTKGWETDAPLNFSYGYQPVGFILANGLPVLVNVLPLLGALLLLKRREA
jgi:hypothetical protein